MLRCRGRCWNERFYGEHSGAGASPGEAGAGSRLHNGGGAVPRQLAYGVHQPEAFLCGGGVLQREGLCCASVYQALQGRAAKPLRVS